MTYGFRSLFYFLFVYIVTYPLDVVRRRMQMKGIKKNVFAYTSTPHAFICIFQKEGVRGLYKGILPNLIKVSCSITDFNHKIILKNT
jgi:hypothetical protein